MPIILEKLLVLIVVHCVGQVPPASVIALRGLLLLLVVLIVLRVRTALHVSHVSEVVLVVGHVVFLNMLVVSV